MMLGSLGCRSEKSGSGRISPPRKEDAFGTDEWAALGTRIAGALTWAAIAAAPCNKHRLERSMRERSSCRCLRAALLGSNIVGVVKGWSCSGGASIAKCAKQPRFPLAMGALTFGLNPIAEIQ